MDLTPAQQLALDDMLAGHNVFLTGHAGTGKSFVIKHLMQQQNIPILASTGVAAILLGGRTFHSFFGLGTMQLADGITLARALKNGKLRDRLMDATAIVIDEVSMLDGRTLNLAQDIAQAVREDARPWGGIQVIAVGDFAQLPPVSKRGVDWAFKSQAWKDSGFKNHMLRDIIRSPNPEFTKILNDVRAGLQTQRAKNFLNARKLPMPEDVCGMRLFPRNDQVAAYNKERLEQLATPPHSFQTEYAFSHDWIKKAQFPLPETLELKIGAQVMIRTNDTNGRYANGTMGIVRGVEQFELLLDVGGREITLGKHTFGLVDADGDTIGKATNFPVNLGYACTIHKSQGMTLDNAQIDLKRVFTPGQGYVALSRLREPEGLYLDGWSTAVFWTDKDVFAFYRGMERGA